MSDEKRRALPHNRDAEEAVIGGILFSGKAMHLVQQVLTSPEDFYFTQLQAIYEAMLAVHEQSQPIDTITVAEQMRKVGSLARLKAYGEESFLLDLSTRVATVDNIGHHAAMVRDRAAKRRLILAASQIVEMGYGDDAPLPYYASALQKLNDAVGTVGRTGPRRLQPLLNEAIRRLEDRYNRKQEMRGIPTGFTDVDEVLGGLRHSRLYIVAARPKMGKTAFAEQILMQGWPALLFSLEMEVESVVDRALVQESRMDGQYFDAGLLDSRDWISVTKAVSRLSAMPVEIDDEPGQDLPTLRAKTLRWRAALAEQARARGVTEEVPALVVVDYLQLTKAAAAKGRGQRSREQEVSEVAYGLKDLAKEARVAVVALGAVSRDCEKRNDKRPGMADLRESGGIEAAADLVAFLYRDEVYNDRTENPGVAEFIIAANRHGPTKTIELKWTGPSVRFDNLTRRPSP